MNNSHRRKVTHRVAQVLWTDYYSHRFVLFVALAVLESHRDVILRYLVEVRSFPILFFTGAYALNILCGIISLTKC